VFVRTNPGSNANWEQQGDPLIVDDGEDGVYSGYRVAIHGDTALISVTHTINGFGRLFVFERSNGVWSQVKMLHTGVDIYDGMGFGFSIALEGNTGKPSVLLHQINSTSLNCLLYLPSISWYGVHVCTQPYWWGAWQSLRVHSGK
jgi:hypothetical protein